MKWNKNGLVAALIMGVATLAPFRAFAVNPYGIEYAGGEPLGADNVQIDSTLVDGFTPLIVMDERTTLEFSDSEKWEEGYIRNPDLGCKEVRYFRVGDDSEFDDDDLSFKMARNQYTADVDFKDVVLESDIAHLEDENALAVGVFLSRGYVFTGYLIYADETCETRAEGLVGSRTSARDHIFVDLKIKLRENGNEFVSDKLYFGMTDVDAAQSYKILNNSNKLSPSNMFALSADVLQPTDTELRNMYVADGNYIYSQYDENGTHFDIHEDGAKNDIYVKINEEAQAEGLNVVFGFARNAWSGIQYFANQYTVRYESDENGRITGTEEEEIISGNHPFGSESEANEGYKLKEWIVDVDVALADGTEIKAGEKISEGQILLVVVDQDITFTAIHEPEEEDKEDEEEPESEVPVPDTDVPNTGASTMPKDGLIVGGGMMVAVALVVLLNVLYWVKRFGAKKVNFD